MLLRHPDTGIEAVVEREVVRALSAFCPTYEVGLTSCDDHDEAYSIARAASLAVAKAVLLEAAKRIRNDPSCVTEVEAVGHLSRLTDELRAK